MECIWSAETGFGSHPDHKRSRPPSSTVLDVFSPVSARARNRIIRVTWYTRFTRVRPPNLSTQLRRTQTSSTVFPPVPTTVVADLKQSEDSEQIRVATIAFHTEEEKTRNLQEAQVSQRRTLSFLEGYPSPCGLTSISAITATTLEKSCKRPKWRHFNEAGIQHHFSKKL